MPDLTALRALRRRGRRYPVAPTVATVVIGAAMVLQWLALPDGLWTDLDVYLMGATSVAEGRPLYGFLVHGLPFTYPPFAALLLVPLTWVPEETAGLVLGAVSAGCYTAILWVCTRHARLPLHVALLLGAAGLALEPFQRNFAMGQINLVLVLLVVVDVFVLPARWRGVLVGVAAGIKLTPGIFVIYYALKRDWAAVRRSIGAGVATVGVGIVVAPSDSWHYWSGGFAALGKFGGDAGPRADNQSLLAEFLRLVGERSAAGPVAVLVCLAGVAAGLLVCALQLRAGNDLAALGGLALGSLLASPITWTHHWLWVLPVLVALAAQRRWGVLWGVGAVLWIAPMWWTFAVGEFRELEYSWWQHVLGGGYVWVGLALVGHLAFGPMRDLAGGPGIARRRPSAAELPARAVTVAASAGMATPLRERAPDPMAARPTEAAVADV